MICIIYKQQVSSIFQFIHTNNHKHIVYCVIYSSQTEPTIYNNRIAYTFQKTCRTSRRTSQVKQRDAMASRCNCKRRQIHTGTHTHKNTETHTHTDKWHGKQEECRNTSLNVNRRRQLKSIVWEYRKRSFR